MRAQELWEEARLRGDLDSMGNLGIHYIEQNEVEKAQEILEEANRMGHPGAALKLGKLYEQAGFPQMAEKLYEEASFGLAHADATKNQRLNLDHVDAVFDLGTLAQEEGDIERAKVLYEEARRRSGHAGATANLAQLYREQGDEAKAQELSAEAWGATPRFLDTTGEETEPRGKLKQLRFAPL